MKFYMKKIFFVSYIILLMGFSIKEIYQQGKASYYASKFEGRRTSSGEIFRQDSLTAAHKTLPFGTRLKVTNTKNDSSIVVKVNDRLSKNSPFIIDLSLRAAKKLNFVRQGIAFVKIEKLN